MNIIIIGSGLAGVTTAYELGKRGFKVTVLDRAPAPAAETSFANGGQLSYTYAEPWATPGVLKKLPGWLIDPDAPLVLRLNADWQMWRWGLKFLRNCTPARARQNCITLMRLGLYSKQKMAELVSESGVTFDHTHNGILQIFSKQSDFDDARRHNEFQQTLGSNFKVMSTAECLAHEPSLAGSKRPIIGGIQATMDELGDAHAFCQNLATIAAEKYGVTFRYGVNIKSLRRDNGRIAAVVTDQGDLSADGFVVAMGSFSPLLLRKVGIDLPIYPMKGYSLTLPGSEKTPRTSVMDCTYKLVYTKLGNRLRVAGTAEFAGHDASINAKRIASISKIAHELFPAVDFIGASPWACLRSSTPDGPPILGGTPYPNLFLNTGHGTLGWTQIAGSAKIVADSIEQKTPDISLHGLTMERF